MKEEYKKECKIIKENCLYTAEAHHIIAGKKKNWAVLFQIVPAIIAAILGSIALADIWPFGFGLLSVISAVITAVANVLNPLKEHQRHLESAKNFTVIKHEARTLCDTFSVRLNDEEFADRVEELQARYGELVKATPATDKKSFEEARKRIKEGIHDPS